MFKDEYVQLVDRMGSDLTVVNSARVSFSKTSALDDNGNLSDRDARLIKYLAEHNHISPFFHPMITVRINMPIFVMRQWYKSQIGFARNETSRRYISTLPEYWTPGEWRLASMNKKQGSGDGVRLLNFMKGDGGLPVDYNDICESSIGFYNELIDRGIAPEQARIVLPQSMMTEFIETASLAAYARLVKLRTTPDAQYEIRLYAERVSTIMSELFPVSWKALMNN